MEEILKEELRLLALNVREQLNLTQSKMAEKLVMRDASYSDIEPGENICGRLTAFMLLESLDDFKTFIQETKAKMDKLHEKDVLPV